MMLSRLRSLLFLFGLPRVYSEGLFCYFWAAAALVLLRKVDWYFMLPV